MIDGIVQNEETGVRFSLRSNRDPVDLLRMVGLGVETEKTVGQEHRCLILAIVNGGDPRNDRRNRLNDLKIPSIRSATPL